VHPLACGILQVLHRTLEVIEGANVANVKLTIEGTPGTITLRAFINAIENWLSILKDVDAAISKVSSGSLDWVVTELAVGSLQVAVAPLSRVEGKNFGPVVARNAVAGLGQIEREGTTPPYWSHASLMHARKMLKSIGNCGVSGIEATYQSDTERASARASANIDLLLPTIRTSLGSVEGVMEAISIHGQPKFVVYQDGTNKAVTCAFSQTWLDSAKEALGRRVSVAGVVHWNRKDEPVRVDVEDLRTMKSRGELPPIVQLAGSVPDLTGDLTTEEYIRRIRENG
jgi:hypothetical protein